MFAFLIFDQRSRTLLAARDHFGVKPLYWRLTSDELLYASEIKALLRWPGVRAQVDESALQDYVTFQHTLDDATLFQGVRKLPPAHLQVVSVDNLAVRTERYWEPDYSLRLDWTEQQAVERLRELLIDSARLQVRSDVPLGAYLSGGLDSSTIATLAAHQVDAGMPVFTGAFREGPEFDESRHARTVAESIGAQLHVVYPSEPEFADLLPRLAWHMDEPAAGPGLFPQYIVSRLAARHVKVCLGGQGGDELFGGYARYLVAYLEHALRASIDGRSDEGPDALPLEELREGLASLKQYRPMLRHFVADGFLHDSPERRYFRLLDRTEGTFGAYSAAFRQRYSGDSVFERFRAVFNRPATRSLLDRMTAFDLASSLPALLQVEDRVSMAVSLESRVPLLDYRIAELLASLPPRLKYRGGQLKHLFRQAVAPWLPQSVVVREDKMGFPVPLQHWAKGRTRDFLHDTLLSRASRERGLYDADVVEQLIGQPTVSGRTLWGLLQLELWHRQFIDQPTH
jgi:asparagine synthase (glutamine-hydrolysing)